jgi:STE24 endopeptidase
MQMLVLAAFMIVAMFGQVPSMDWPGAVILAAAAAYVVSAGLLARVTTSLYLRSARKGAEEANGPALRRHTRRSNLVRVWLLAGLAWLMYAGMGQWVSRELELGRIPLAADAAQMLPFLLALLAAWAGEYRFYRHAWQKHTDRPCWTLGQFLLYNTRHHFLFLAVPVGLIILLSDSLRLYVGPLLPPSSADYIVGVGTLVLATGVFFVSPVLIVRVWNTARLESGELRDRLEATCRTLGLKYRDILVWRSAGVVVNAAVLGLVGRFRYILLSDGLIDQMDQTDIDVVFGHEAGHIVHHHMFYAALFTIATAVTCAVAASAVAVWLVWPDWAASLVLVAMLALAWWQGFGWVSRRFERQSDVTGAWAVARPAEGEDPDLITHEGAAACAKALGRIGQLSAIPANRMNWRHGALAGRISYVLWLGSTARTRREIDRVVNRIKIASIALFALASLLGALWIRMGEPRQ